MAERQPSKSPVPERCALSLTAIRHPRDSGFTLALTARAYKSAFTVSLQYPVRGEAVRCALPTSATGELIPRPCRRRSASSQRRRLSSRPAPPLAERRQVRDAGVRGSTRLPVVAVPAAPVLVGMSPQPQEGVGVAGMIPTASSGSIRSGSTVHRCAQSSPRSNTYTNCSPGPRRLRRVRRSSAAGPTSSDPS